MSAPGPTQGPRVAAPGVAVHGVRGSRAAVALTLWGWLALAVSFVPVPVLRPVLVWSFVCAGPGLAIVRLLPRRDLLEQLVVVLASSLSIAAVVSEAFDLAGAGSSHASLAALAALVTVLVAASRRDRRRQISIEDGARR